jgi:hypothetical protein
MARYQDEDGSYTISGFPTFELAGEFARRWVRDSLEELRKPSISNEELRRSWFLFGEDAAVMGDEYFAGSQELDFFILNPATPEECDWKAIKQMSGIR